MIEPNHTISLREYIDIRFDALDKAIGLSRDEMNRRLEGLNQLRNEVVTDRSVFTTRDKCDAKHALLSDWQVGVNKKLTVLETRSITWTAAVGVFFLILNLAFKWLGK